MIGLCGLCVPFLFGLLFVFLRVLVKEYAAQKKPNHISCDGA